MPHTWNNFIPSPQDGDFADAAGLKNSFSAIDNRTQYLRSRLEEFSKNNGRTMILNVPCSPDVIIGNALYYNHTNETFEPAIAEGEVGDSGVLIATKRAFALGICVYKDGETSCDILTFGECNLKDDFNIDIYSMLDLPSGVDLSGINRIYLSSLFPGKITTKPISPLIQLGIFSEFKSFVAPLQKDIFESHLHHKFEIPMIPAAIPKDGIERVEWAAYLDNTERGLVDYSSRTLAAAGFPNNAILTYAAIDILPHINPGYDESSRVIVEVSRSGENMTITIKRDISSIEDPFNLIGVYPPTTIERAWPLASEKVYVDGTNFVFSLFRIDGGIDTKEELGEASSKMSFILPDDLKGWTNADPGDSDVPEGCYLKLLPYSITSLDSVWPPVPLESIRIETRGVGRMPEKEYVATNRFIYWKSPLPPWRWNPDILPLDEAYLSTLSDIHNSVFNRAHIGELFFGNTSLSNARSVVLSLSSITPAIEVTDCFSGKPSRAGHLNLDFHLSLLEDNKVTFNEKAFNTYSETYKKFQKTAIVSEVEAGPGIFIENIGEAERVLGDNGQPRKYGRIKISSNSTRRRGSIDIVSLVNAKEDMLNDIVPIVYFPAPGTGTYKMVSSVLLPDADEIGTVNLSLSYKAAAFGLVNGASNQEYNAMFNLSHYIIKKNSSIALSQLLGTPSNASYLDFTIPVSYQRLTPVEFPTRTLTMDTNSIPLQNGDRVFTVWHRVPNTNNTQDTYGGSFGFFQIEWNITIV